MKVGRSKRLYRAAARKIPGGVNSPVRAWKAVGGQPLFIDRGAGAKIIDVDGRSYIDFVGSWGPLILGHAHPRVVQAVQKAAARGTTFGAPTAAEVELAALVSKLMPSIEKLRLVVSGTEAAMSALRLARAVTGRTRIVKFDGCYHGHADGLLARAGSGVATLGLPESPGVPPSFAAETLVSDYNDAPALERLFKRYGQSVAAVIVEPVCGNMGVIPPALEFLRAARRLTRRYGALLVFDEVITGFRVDRGGAQALYGIEPDITCLGKILGGGLPQAGFGGRSAIMDRLAPQGPVYQAGTLAGNPLAVAAGLTTLKQLSRAGVYERLERKAAKLQSGFEGVLSTYRLRATVNRVGSMMTVFFGVDGVRNAREARASDRARFARFFHGMLERGYYFPPSPFEAFFLSLAHTEDDITGAIEAFADWAAGEPRG